ncbi:ANKRD50 [Symbiodinium sp. CCMP2592]|nr:ANKRD50 [Symbiodinium sp. CCMP2592]
MSDTTNPEEVLETEAEMSSWSSAFDFLAEPAQTNRQNKKKKKKDGRDRRARKKPSKKAGKKLVRSSDSAEIAEFNIQQQASSSNEPATNIVPMAESGMQTAPEELQTSGEFTFVAVWRPGPPPPRIGKTRAVAKMLVRAGLRAETVIADATGNQDRWERELLRLFPCHCLSCRQQRRDTNGGKYQWCPVQPPLPPPSTPAPIAPVVPVPQQQTTWNRQPWVEVAAADARRAAKEADQDEADDETSYLASLWKSAEDEARADPTRPLSARELAEQGKLQWWWKMPWKAVVEKFPDTAAYKEFLEGLEGPIPGQNPVAGVVGPDAHMFRVPGQRILILSCELRGPSYIRNPNSEHSAIMAHGTSFPSLVGVAEIGEIAVNDYRDQGIPCFGFSARGSLVALSRDALESAATKCASRAKALGGAIILVECELPRSTPSVEGGNEMMQICCRDAGSAAFPQGLNLPYQGVVPASSVPQTAAQPSDSGNPAYRRVLTLLHAFSSFFDLCTLMADDEEVSEVLQLHAICCDRDISVIDRCGAAHFLAMLYARARASDIRCVKSILIDVHNEVAEVSTATSLDGAGRQFALIEGHHADAATGSDAVYGRELQSAALREYVVVLDAVATGKFLPDQTRSGHFSSGWTRESILQAAAFPQDSEVLQAAVEDDQDEALAVVSDVSDSDEEAPEEQSFWAHPTSQVLRRTTLGSAMFLCGRAFGDHYRRIPMARAQAHPQCAKCFPRYLAMTSSVDSAPFFVHRADEISLAKRVVDALKGKGVTTLAQLAFCVGQPGQVLSQTEFDTWSEAMLVGITVGEKASLRRLILEAQTMLVASLKDLAEPAEHASPKKVGVAERNARMDQLRTQLAGVSLTGQLEPSHALLDMAVQQWESRCLKYIGPEKCHSREDEVQNVKPLTTSLSLEGGKLKVTEAAGMDDRDIEGSLQVLNALRRRGVAYAFARLISWERHEAYVSSLFRYLTKPAQPGYRKVSLRQILRADKLAFSKLSEAGEDIRADASGTLPLDAAIGAILHDYDLIVALLPMGDLDGKGKNANGRGGRPGPYSDNAPWKGKNGKGKGGWNTKEAVTSGSAALHRRLGVGRGDDTFGRTRFRCRLCSPPVGVGVDPASEMVDVDDSPIFVEPTVLDPPTMPSASSEPFALERTESEGALPSPPVASEDFSPAPPTQEPARAVLQCFAGQARVASALIKQGYFSYGVDRFKQKAAMAPVLQMDLSTREACDSVLTWLDNRKIAGVMICIPKHASEPVTTAFVLAVMAGCLSNNLPMVLEGSVSSPFWESFNRLPSAQHPPHRVEVDWQLWDSHSKQRSLVWSNLPEILTVRREAAPMGRKVQQRSEAQTGYPPAFATAIAEVFIAGLTQRQLPCRSPALANKSLRVSAMNQPRGAMPEVVSEWKLVVYVLLPPQVEDPFGGSKRLKQDWRVPHGARVLPELKLLPQDSQLLSRTQSGGQLSPQLQQEMQNLNGASVLRVGIPWDPIEFIAKAGKIGHPYHKLSKCNKDLRDLVHDLVHKPGPVRSQRKNYIEKWARRAKELEPEETKLKAGMSDHRRKILQPKRILLFEEMLRDIGYDDMGVVQELIDGATLTGDIPITGVLDTKLKPARLDTEQLIGMSDEIRQQIRVKTGSSGDKEIDQLLWDKTMEEVQSGYLSGPYDFESLPKRCLVSSRFPLLQGEKLRPIDNYSSSLINDTVTVSEKPITHSIDEIALLINTLSSAARKKNLNALYGKTADLKGAYRQLAVSDTSLDFSYLSVYDPAEEKPKLFQQLAVPFGSTKAVYFFLRVARALWTILVKGARIPTTNYFDDFVLLALGGDRSSCSHAFDEVMRLPGWKLSADKTTEWDTSFEALGVLFELDQTGSGVLKVRNTEKRRKELTAAIKGFLDKGTMTQKEALQLRGRVQFAQAQFFGRLGRRCLTEVTKHAYTGRSKLSSMAKERLEEFGKFLDMAQPRLVGQVSCRTFMILTDAAFETESGTGGLGGVLLTGSGSALSFFSVPISEQQAKSMSLQDEHTIIYELEMFGVLIGLKLLVEKTAAFAESYEQPGAVAGTGVICYIDNDAARHAYIVGSSKKGVAGILIDEVNFLEYVHGILPWYARVASPANLADEPSRMKLDRVKRLGFRDESVEATKAVLSIVKRVSNLPA